MQEIIRSGLKSSQLNLTDDQRNNLQKWFDENASSWASLKKAASIKYCNAAYKNISFVESTDQDDFSNPSDTGYGQIRYLYSNIDACRLAGIYDFGWLDLFQMEIGTSRHFIYGKCFIDQLAGYSILWKSLQLLASPQKYTSEDLQKARGLLKEYFPVNLPLLGIEGETLIYCSAYESLVNKWKIPFQTPLNPMFTAFGSSTGTETYVRKSYTDRLEQAQKGIEVERKEFSITDLRFPIMRKILFHLTEGSTEKVYKIYQRANAGLSAAYVLLDLEEYKLIKGSYPTDISQLKQAGLTSQLPDDPDGKGKIIYRNDGERAILYAVGKNAKDDGGYTDDKESDKKRDDMIYWQREN